VPRLLLLLALLAPLTSCRYLGSSVPLHGGDRPALDTNGDPTDPTRDQPLPKRRCVVTCGPGLVCDEAKAECVAVPVGHPDAGAAWMP
jgi:hypothetical protein